jgi:hypothetical protein
MDTHMPGAGTCDVVTGVAEDASPVLEMYPNPFERSVRIKVRTKGQDNSLEIRDVYGRNVLSAHIGHEWEWTGQDASGLDVAPGLYILRVVDATGNVIGQTKIVRR